MNYKFCLIGNPVEQSKSPWIHEQFSKQFGIKLEYYKIKTEAGNFEKTIEQFRKDGGHGFNVTMPFKQDAYQIADELSERAKIAKAVNTMLFQHDGKLYGDNTDGIGLITDITENLNFSLKNKSILILGAGGAVRGILYPILMSQPEKVTIANRTIEKAQQLAIEFGLYGDVTGCGFSHLENTHYDIIIDGTGFTDHELQIPTSLTLSANSLCYDIKYKNIPTPFIQWSKREGTKTISDGIGMMIEQAAEAFFIWTGYRPNTKTAISLAKTTFYDNSTEESYFQSHI